MTTNTTHIAHATQFNANVGTQNNYFGQSVDDLVAQFYSMAAEECEGLTLTAVKPIVGNRDEASAADVYVPPDAYVVEDAKADSESQVRDQETRRVPLEDCVKSDDPAMQRLVLTAPSGFGKSTAVNGRVAAVAKSGVPWLMLRLPSLRMQSLLPDCPSVRQRVACALRHDIVRMLGSDITKVLVASIANLVIRKLDETPGVIMFDALDEVPHSERDDVVACVRSFLSERAHQQPSHRVLITSRPYAYTEQFRNLNFKRIELAEFTPAQQDALIGKWFSQTEKSPATGRKLVAQLAANRSGANGDATKLAALMSEPMLLTYACMLADGNADASTQTPLPPTRHDVFDGVVRLMLEQWDPNRKHGAVDTFRALFDRTPEKSSVLRQLLERAAFEELRAQSPAFELEAIPGKAYKPPVALDDDRTLTRERLVYWLDEAMPDALPVRARTVVDWLAERSGLLHATRDENGTRYVLQAQLRDFLALGGLRATVKSDQEFVDALLSLLRSQPQWYRPLSSLALARLREKPLELAHAIGQILATRPPADSVESPDVKAKLNSTGATPAHAILHFVIAWANAFGEAGPSCGKDGALESALQKLREYCLELVTAPAEGKPPIQLRVEAADALGLIGDLRFDPARWHLPSHRVQSQADEPIPGFVRIAAGEFTMGDKLEEDNLPRQMRIDHPFYIARYATTVAQFRHFVEAGGYDEKQWWDDDGLLWLNGQYDKRVPNNEHLGWLSGRPLAERQAPVAWVRQLQAPSRPVVGVSWFEARAYALWLDCSLHATLQDVSLADHVVLLPTELQWERASRLGASGKGYDNRRWPQGDDEAGSAHAHLGGSLIQVATVGLFKPTAPRLFDMVGNAWEWMDNAYRLAKNEPFERAPRHQTWHHAATWHDVSESLSLRGGSWKVEPEHAPCSYRRSSPPVGWHADVGFRVVLSLAKNET